MLPSTSDKSGRFQNNLIDEHLTFMNLVRFDISTFKLILFIVFVFTWSIWMSSH